MSKTDPIDPAVPAGSEDPKLGDNRIRELAAAVAEILAVDHYIGTNGGAGTGYNEDAAGEHAKVTIRNGSAPTAAAGKGFLYVVSGELYYKDPSGNVIQLTSGGILNSLNLTGNQTAAGVKTFSSQAAFAAGLTAAAAIISTLVTGTAPFTVASTTKVANLNADQVDGFHVTAPDGTQSYTIAGGLILKQGQAAFSGSDLTVTFGEAFPTECIRVIACLNDTAWSTNYAPKIISKSASNFVVSMGNATSLNIDWIAIGR
jgi:hypothetical protein